MEIKHPLPSFVIDFSAAKWDFITYLSSPNQRFISGDVFIPNVASLHFRSEKDPLYSKLNCSKNFESPVVIEFEGGHRPPKILSEDAILVTAQFFVD
jgi:hypothetical protein